MITSSVNLSDGPLRQIASAIAEADGAYVKVGVLSSGSKRVAGSPKTAALGGNKRWTNQWTRWKSSAGQFVTSKASWSASMGKYLTNAEIGAIHEFGAPNANIPERSFLRMPILSRLSDELKTVPLAAWEGVFLAGGLIGVLKVVGQAAVNIVHDAFHTGGFGRWAKLKPSTIRRKGSSDVLVDTTQLRRSISFAVVSKR